MLLSLEGHIVEHVKQHLFGGSLYKGRSDLEGPSCLWEFHALGNVNVRGEAVVLEPKRF